jgi:hypothetical protein
MSLNKEELSKITKDFPTTTSVLANACVRLYLASPNPAIVKLPPSKRPPGCILTSFPQLTNEKWVFTGIAGVVLLVIDRSSNAVLFQIFDLDNKKHVKRFEYELYIDLEYQWVSELVHAFEIEECIAGFQFSSKDASKAFFPKVRNLIPSPQTQSMIQISSPTRVVHQMNGKLYLNKLV